MPDGVRVATPLDFLPRYVCPHCDQRLRYDDVTNPDTHETGAQCDLCGRTWIITGTSTAPHPEHGGGSAHAFSMRELVD